MVDRPTFIQTDPDRLGTKQQRATNRIAAASGQRMTLPRQIADVSIVDVSFSIVPNNPEINGFPLPQELLTATINLANCCSNLTVLNIALSRWVIYDFIQALSNTVKNLRYLNITGCYRLIGSTALDPLGRLKNCTDLYMSNLNPDVGERFLAELQNLRLLEYRDNHGITDDHICNLFSAVPTVNHIGLEGC